GLWMPDVANIRNPRLGQALVADLLARSSVSIHEHCRVAQFAVTGRRVDSVIAQTADGEARYTASNIVLCAGAWSGQLAELTGVDLTVEPVKGQMLLYRFEQAPVKSIVLTQGRYAIPRRDGHLLVGSTLEYQQFDKSPTDAARASLMESAQKLLPLLKGAVPVTQWAGLRPAAPDGVPFIGKLPGYENFYVNAGQFRNGLVLAPASARLLADILLQRQPIVDPTPYLPGDRQGLQKTDL
ncbi:MAG: FAD-dependent oxidoreductase, partial [Gammaproteobacteria bacterium]|nr:FAD-dependent oxidoreductase [Gammaproteobacteria bacterium]